MTGADKTQALIEEARQQAHAHIGGRYWRDCSGCLITSLSDALEAKDRALEAEKARADALRGKVQALADEWRTSGNRRCARCANDVQRLLADSQDNQEATK